MLARTLGPKFSRYPAYLQPKLNGIRCLQQHGTFQSRGEKIWKPTFFPHILAELRTLGLSSILDGELYVHGWRLQRIASATGVNTISPNTDTPSIEYHIFDIVDPARSFADRWLPVYEQVYSAGLRYVKVVPTILVSNAEEMRLEFEKRTNEGYEGVMLRPNGPYEFGMTERGTEKRSEYLWKHKQWEDGEFRCIGTTPGEGKASIGIGALILEHPKISDDWPDAPPFKVGTGLTDEDRIEFAKNPPILKTVRVRYLELTAAGIPFNPSFLGVLS